ncbi:MAG: ABC transporter ATP-binding protein [Planctomycetia bacterium]|nr:ABC transporter ATP-binding protein [Planctomycetia bacterium]
MARVSLRDVHLTFTLRKRGSTSIKDSVLRALSGRPAPKAPTVEAIRGLDLEMRDGDRLGIIGHNGAGKSSLLRLLAGVYRPTSGKRIVEGRISSLFELHLGFDEDANGWENIRYRGYLLKETPASLDNKIAEIAEFTELGDALDRPIRYYSAGMLVRLAFAISTAIEPEVLLVDEVLAAGDMAFMEKAQQRMNQLMDRASVMVLVSHSLKTVEQVCNRVLWMDHGQAKLIGEPSTVVESYRNFMKAKAMKAA